MSSNNMMSSDSKENQDHSKNKVWNSARVADCIILIEDGRDNEIIGRTPFHEGNPEWRTADIVYDYSEEEMREIARCASDVVYFANKYCMAMTDYGIQKITLRTYQEEVLKSFQSNRFNVFLASRQIGKTLLSQTIIEILNKSSNKSQKITYYKFYYSIIQKTRKLSIHEKIKLILYDLESKLTHSKIYKLEI